jgi:signal transduction histidine kinase
MKSTQEEVSPLTIKQRLFVSNMLMLVMPIILTILMFACVIFILAGITGARDMRGFRDGYAFFDAVMHVENWSKRLTSANVQDIVPELDKMSDSYKPLNISLAVFEGESQVYPLPADMNFVTEELISQMTLPVSSSYLTAKDGKAVYGQPAGKYSVVLLSRDFSFSAADSHNRYIIIGILFFGLSILIVFLVNRALTLFVTKKITAPIDILVSGVHELRDGNLDCRINYDGNDEFRAVCDDFNDMARRLSDMVAARQKDEESRKELIAGISHDLRTPLTSIKAYVEGIEKGVASAPHLQSKYLETIKRKTEDLEHIINQLFLFSKLDIGEFPLKMERVDVKQMVVGFVQEAAREYENKGLALSFGYNPGEESADFSALSAEIDVVQFRNVLHNILTNSVKYKDKDCASSVIAVAEQEGSVVITVTDDGAGVPESSLDKLFDVFYRDDISRSDPSSGSGLGLAIARKIIEGFGGKIRGENVPEGGLMISIVLPGLKNGSVSGEGGAE